MNFEALKKRPFAEENAMGAKQTESPQMSAIPNSALIGNAKPTATEAARTASMPIALRQKMESSFGADFSGIKMIESQRVADGGADAITLGGGTIGFAPGKLDFNSRAGQELIGHELSHVVSHARGEVKGSGFLGDSKLEAQADSQGAMAAAGQSVYSGPVAPISESSIASAEGPMQAKKKQGGTKKGGLLSRLPIVQAYNRRKEFEFINNIAASDFEEGVLPVKETNPFDFLLHHRKYKMEEDLRNNISNEYG